MDTLSITAVIVGLIGLITSILAQISQSSNVKTGYRDLLKRTEKILSGKPISVDPLNTRLENALNKLTGASTDVSNLLNEIQTDVNNKFKEAERLKATIQQLQKEHDDKASLASLTPQQLTALIESIKKELSASESKSSRRDILINFSVGAFFFIMGIIYTRIFSP